MLKIGTLKISYVFTFILVLILSLFSNVTFLAINSISLKMLKQILQEKFFSTFVSSMPVNLNQYRGTVGVFNNHSIAFCNFCNMWYSKSFRKCSTFIFFNEIFSCAAYLFALLECLKSSFLSSLRVQFRSIHSCLNLILCIILILLYDDHF